MEKSKTFSNEFDDEMFVKKRNGEMEIVAFDKILRRIRTIGTEVGIKINYTTLAMKVIDQLYNGISTTKIDELSAQQCASLASTHPDYNVLAGRITISNHHKNTSDSFVDIMTSLYDYKDTHGKSSPLLSDELFEVVQKYKDEWENILDYQRDYLIDYFGFKTLERAYLMQINKVTVERPQHMWLRVAIGIHGDNMEQIRITYENMSQKYFTHATPTLFNAGTPHPQLSSCFLLAMEKDSIEGIYNTLKDCALISKWAGGIGLHIHNVRASGSHIRGTNGSSNGIVPMLKVFNNTAKYVDQCVLPTTIIYTKQGPMHISKCISGVTEIFNRTGNLETIENVLEHAWSGPILEITLFEHLSHPLSITPEHPIYVLPNYTNKDENEIKNDLDLGLTRFEWIEAKDITPKDGIVYSIPQYELDFPALTEEICYFYGIILAGLILYNENRTSVRIDPNYMYVMQSPSKIEELAEFLNIMNIPYEMKIHDYYNVIVWEKGVNLPFRHSDFYYSSNTDCFAIGQRWLYLPLNKTEKILAGFKNVNIYNESIIHYIFFLKLRLGDIENSVRYKNNLIVKVEHILQRHYHGPVYDLQMTDQHNYLLNGGLVHNGGGKRNGSFAIYLEPWHSDIELFLQMRKNHGDEELKARDLFYALWISDLFMERVKADGKWTLMCPDECPGLADVYGDDFVNLYTKYEADGKGKKTVKARELWFQILDAQMETGTPYLLYKDACNKKSNQKNVGTIKSSNLCVAPETMILTDNGYFEIQSLHNQAVNIWNGDEFSEVTIHKTGENQELIDVYTNDGCKLTCTKYHKFFIQKSDSIELVHSCDLSIGDTIIEWKNIDNTIHPSVKIEKIVDEGRIDDTYCFNEPKKHAGIFNGIITSQCTEILEYSDENETAVCNLASIGLPTFVDKTSNPPTFNYEKLHEISRIVTYNLNRIIDVNYYPTPKTERSNKRHRPIGIGVQGLADVFMMMNLPFSSDEAKMINKMIFETIYHGALIESCNIAKIEGKYETFDGSPASKGELQFDLWNVEPCTNRYDWTTLKTEIKTHGLRNSLLLAPMPTASTSQILGFNECIEPITSNIYSRRTIAGEFILANKYLMNDLIALDLWNEKIKNNIIANHGSIQHLEMIPPEIKEKYKTVWEIPMRNLIDMAADRGAYICQSQSLNLWLEDPNYSNLTSMHFYSWSKGLKTGIYYLRRRGRHQAQQFTIEPEKKESGGGEIEEDEICEMCSA
jgi:ribonucleotide reductase alpha subunit